MGIDAQLRGSAGNGPPKDVPASELVRKLSAVGASSEVLPFPRNGSDGKPVFEYRCRVLTQAEIDACGAASEEHARKVFKGDKRAGEIEIQSIRSEAWDEVYQNAKIVELLFRACREVDVQDGNTKHRHLFDSPAQMRNLLTSDEIASLFHAYATTQAKYGPLWRMLSEEDVDAWIEKLSMGFDAYPLAHLEHAELVQLVLSLAYRLAPSKTDTGSSGSQSDPGTSETSHPTPGDEE